MFLIDDIAAGMLKAAVSGNSRQALRSAGLTLDNSLRIWKGLLMGNTRQVLSRLTWELPQTLLGFLMAHLANWLRPVESVRFVDGATVLEGGGYMGSVSFGTYILLYPGYTARPGEWLFMHEYGHTLQSRESGPLYLFKYGLPSLFTDNYSWVEMEANGRASRYFALHHHVPASAWEGHRGRKAAPQPVQPKWWEYLLLISIIGIPVIVWLNMKKDLS